MRFVPATHSAPQKTLNALEVASSQPGNETASQQLAAPLAFYRGVCEANLGHSEKAQVDFEAFLSLRTPPTSAS